MKQIQYTPMFEMVLDSLRDSIISGVWRPGELLSHEQIAARLNVSRMPVREAVRLLEQEGFVSVRRNVGVEVLPLSWDDFEEIYLMRQALESLAGRLATPNLRDADLDRLRGLLDQMERVLDVAASQPGQTLVLTREFHSTIYRPCGRPRLLKSIDTLRNHSARYRAFVVQLPGRAKSLLSEHTRIYEACLQRDEDAVADAIHVHFQQALDIARHEKEMLP